MLLSLLINWLSLPVAYAGMMDYGSPLSPIPDDTVVAADQFPNAAPLLKRDRRKARQRSK